MVTTLRAVNDSEETESSCGMSSTTKYKMNNGQLERDPINHRRVLESVTIRTPSGLVREVLYSKAFNLDADNNLLSFTSTTTLNGKTIQR
ncbi:MAG: Unknown protein [uncultured Sulfurovum sp.]|uniref:Uncharacterized protein n=1 Tax=uncultured Sulfurovum sp. TaxID=269237 RepID=A0A6S6SM23_9BACT|nr:MAG: Unknown protein [uncultured Sulfurovum sp.]